MSTEILMPALSPTMSEGKLSKWLVKEGDIIKAGDNLPDASVKAIVKDEIKDIKLSLVNTQKDIYFQFLK